MSVRDRIKMMEQMAMKEREGAPEERGRSPGGVSAKSNASNDSPRPLSKVRTSFVAIEKDGRIGLQREASGDSSSSGKQFSAETEAPVSSSTGLHNTRNNVSSPDTNRPDPNRGPSGIGPFVNPSSIPDRGPASAQPAPSAGRAVPGSPFTTAAPPSATPQPVRGLAGPVRLGGGWQEGLAESPEIRQASRSEAQGGPSVGPPGESGSSHDQASKEHEVQAVAVTAPPAKEGSQTVRDSGPDKGRSGGSAGRGPTVPEAIVAAPLNGAAAKAKATLPTATRTPSSQSKPVGKPHDEPKRSMTPPTAARKSTTDKKTPSTVSPGGFVKPKARSPTRPVELPARLTTHTAASGQKTKNPPPPAHGHRPASRTSVSSSVKGLGRSSSVVSQQRPSFGPPPKQIAKDHPVPKKEAKVDEGFLARMMRPTQASASKMADKVHIPTTPPRKSVTATRKPASAQSGSSRKAVSTSKTTSAPQSVVATPDLTKKDGRVSTSISAKSTKHTPIVEEASALSKQAKQTDASSSMDLEEALAYNKLIEKESPGDEGTPLPEFPNPPVKDAAISSISKVEELPKRFDDKENAPEMPRTETHLFEQKDDPETLVDTSTRQQGTTQSPTIPAKAADAVFAVFMDPTFSNAVPGTTDAPQAKDVDLSNLMNLGKTGASYGNGNRETREAAILEPGEEEW